MSSVQGEYMEPTKTDEPAQTTGQEPQVDVKALQDKLEQALKSQSGVDKTLAETTKAKMALELELEKIKKEKMSEKEKADYELMQKSQQLELKSREVAEASLRFSKMQILSAKQVPAELFDYIGGANEEEISTNADTFLKRFNEAVGKGVEAKLAGNKSPQAGNTAAPSVNIAGLSFKEMDRLAREGKL
jgi:hypothetical protein